MANLNESNEDGLAGMSGMTAYNRVEGEFFLHQMPAPDEQTVKQTIQGVVDEFIYRSEDVALQSILKQNDAVRITETGYLGETKTVFNESKTSHDTDATGEPYNRIIIQGGAGAFEGGRNLSASTHDEIVAIAIDDIRPFLIKGLDIDYTAEINEYDKPTNDGYIRHLTPSGKTLIASIKSPSVLTAAGGPSRILVHYESIDLTGEVIAGTGLPPDKVNRRIRPFHSESHKPYLVVKKTVPSGSTLFDISGVKRSLSNILMKPYPFALPPSTASDVQLDVVAAGGVIEVPTRDFKRPIKSHVLKSHGFDGSFPSPFINIEQCVLSVKNSAAGYGRPKAVVNTNTPDPTANPMHHIMTITPNTGEDLSGYTGSTETPSAFTRSSLQVFNILDNEVNQNQHLILVAPANKNRYAGLEDFLGSSETVNPPNVAIEIALLNGRAEEFNTLIDTDGAELEIRGRSNLMDITDSEIKRNLNLGKSIPIKEIGDMGSPTVSMTLGGVGQGGADVQATWTEHETMKGWKDKIVGSGNVSVRNDRQTSTDYASTRALVEFPLFPSMFFDTDGLYRITDPTTSNGNPITHNAHAKDKSFEIEIDCTMTAMNRVQMSSYEARNCVDWGAKGFPKINFNGLGALNKANSPYSYGLKAIQPSIQTVITSGSALTSGASGSYLQVDSVDAFVNETLQGSDGINRNTSTGVLGRKMYVIVGEGQIAPVGAPTLAYCNYYHARVWKIDTSNNRLYIDKAFNRYPQNDEVLNLSASSPSAAAGVFEGASVVMGGVVVNDLTAHNSNELKADYGDVNFGSSQTITALQNALALSGNIVKISGINRDLGMGCLTWDVFNEWSQDNNRQLREPIECFSVSTGLKGISADGESLVDVQPMVIDFRDIALKVNTFDEAVEELVRRINMAGHPDAQEIQIIDLGDGELRARPPTSAYTSHMGYVRAYVGSDTESRSGESGKTIVIHSTVPGAAGRNFAIRFKNNSYYPYRPLQAFGHGGLLATNSRSYQLNSFPAPMPLGADGETYAPITTFTGAVHGPLRHHLDTSASLRTYDGIGKIFETTTKAGGAITLPTTGYGPGLNTAYFWHSGLQKFEWIRVKANAADYRMRSEFWKRKRATGNSETGGILRVNGFLATFGDLRINFDATGYADDEMYFINVKVLGDDPDNFKDSFFQGTWTHPTTTERTDLKIEILHPLMDSEGILFFGGGHTGLVFDISDGTRNDYSDFYKHPLANGPTGFAGFQNLGKFGTASTILDFTDILNEDTINDDTLRGWHHRDYFTADGQPESALFYARMLNGIYDSSEDVPNSALTQSNAHWREDGFNRKLRLTGHWTGVMNYITNGVETTPTGSPVLTKLFHDGCVAALFNNNGGAVEVEHPLVKDFIPAIPLSGGTINDFTISAVVSASPSNPDYATGPIFHAIADGGSNLGIPYGLSIGGEPAIFPPAIGKIPISVALTFPNTFPLGSPVACGVLDPSAIPGGKVEYYKSGFLFIMAGKKDGLTFLYMGHTQGITNPTTGNIEIGFFDYSAHIFNTQDHNYGLLGGVLGVANNKPTFETRSSGYSGGDADHPNVPSALGTIRDINMATVGCALFGAPHIEHGGATKYFTELASSNQTFGVTGTGGSFGDGKNSAGPIHFAGFLSDVALWKRSFTFTEAQVWFDSRNVW